jgi:hypothetical protein
MSQLKNLLMSSLKTARIKVYANSEQLRKQNIGMIETEEGCLIIKVNSELATIVFDDVDSEEKMQLTLREDGLTAALEKEAIKLENKMESKK